MEQENKKLLSIDISARLPYNIKCQFTLKYGDNGHKEGTYLATITTFDGKDWLEIEYNDTNGASGKPWLRDWSCSLDDIKPYLRPMSSMTDEEKKEYYKLCISKFIKAGPGYTYNGWWEYYDTTASIDWATKKMFDYRGLIKKGLALEAPKDMYRKNIEIQIVGGNIGTNPKVSSIVNKLSDILDADIVKNGG